MLESGSRDFSTRDVSILTSLTPHFQLAQQQRTIAARRDHPLLEILTPREAEVTRLAATGMTNKQIAACLFVSPGTVRKHLDNIYAKTGTHNRTTLAVATSRN